MTFLWQPIPAAANVEADVTVDLTGVAATGQLGTLTASSGVVVAVTGVEATGQQGTLGAQKSVALTGLQGTGQLGTLAKALSVAITGQQATGQLGTVTASTSSGNVTVNLTGVEASGQLGNLGIVNPAGDDTHDGFAWRKYRERLERIVNLPDAIEAVKEAPEEVIEAIQESEIKPSVKAKVSKVDYSQIANNLKLQRFIAKQLMVALELQRIAQEDDDLMTFMMMD